MTPKRQALAKMRATAPPQAPPEVAPPQTASVGHIDERTALLVSAFHMLANASHPSFVAPPPLFPMIAHASFEDVFGSLTAKSRPDSCDVALLPAVHQWLSSNVRRMRYRAALFVRKLVSVETDPPLQEVIDSGVTRLLCDALTDHSDPQLQFEAAWALTNVASGAQQHTAHVVEIGALPHFVALLSSPSKDVREQAVWALGNVAGDGASFRDTVLALHPVSDIVQIMADTASPVTLLRNAAWALSNLCRSKPPPDFELVQGALEAFALLICSTEQPHIDTEARTDALWGLSYISDTTDAARDFILLNYDRVLPMCIAELSSASMAMQTPALRVLGNFAAGTAQQTDALLDLGIMTQMSRPLASPKRAIRKEACWTISNLLADSPRALQECISANLMPAIFQCAVAGEHEVKKEALWCIANGVNHCDASQIDYLIAIDICPVLKAALELYDGKLVVLALTAIEEMLQRHVAPKTFADTLQDQGLTGSLEMLQQNANEEVYERVMRILETYFEAEAAEENDTTEATGASAPGPAATGFNFSF